MLCADYQHRTITCCVADLRLFEHPSIRVCCSCHVVQCWVAIFVLPRLSGPPSIDHNELAKLDHFEDNYLMAALINVVCATTLLAACDEYPPQISSTVSGR